MMEKTNNYTDKVGQPTPTSYRLSEAQKLNFQALHILYFMVKKELRFANFLTGKLKLVENVIELLEQKKLIVQTEIEPKSKKIFGYTYTSGDNVPMWVYSPTPAAEDVVKNYEQRLFEFYKHYDVFAHVDTESGEFALENISYTLINEGEESWNEYLDDDRWLDLRIPVCNYKGIDPREIVFLSKVTSSEYDLDINDLAYNWVDNLFTDQLWNEIYKILDTAPKWEQFDFHGNPSEFMEDVIIQGAEIVANQNAFLNKFIHQKTKSIEWADGQIGNQRSNDDDDDRYDHRSDDEYYRDPVRYVGPWGNPLSDPLFWMIVIL